MFPHSSFVFILVVRILIGMVYHVICVEPSGVQALKNPNPLKDVEASAVLDVVVLV